MNHESYTVDDIYLRLYLIADKVRLTLDFEGCMA